MLRYAKYAVPYILKAPRRSPVKSLAGLALSYILFLLGAIFLLIAAFIWVATHYGTDTAFLSLGTIFLISAAIFMMIAKDKRYVKPPLPDNVAQDPLAAHIPASVRENPTVQKLLLHVSENPVAATATAVTLGMLISNEFFEEKK
ncbi:phage holin family protein [Fretibacter rubidus]|uniref:phage holin family protein n=1 Tax=Fretibacter rubidus TaxID=570162 RepID=UPI00352B4417